MKKFEDSLSHYGVLGMRWGHRKREDSGGGRRSHSQRNADILKKNPFAAVVNHKGVVNAAKKLGLKEDESLTPEQMEARRKRIRNIAIGVGIGVGVAAGALLYAKNKKAVDATVNKFLENNGFKKPSDLKISDEQWRKYENLGIKIRKPSDINRANFVARWIDSDNYRYSPISKEAFDALDTQDVRVKAGQVFHRLSHDHELSLRDGAYVSFDPDDVNRYKALLPALRKPQALFTKLPSYDITMKATEDIVSPSAKKRVEMLAELIYEDPSIEKHLAWKANVPRKVGLRTREWALSVAREQYNNVAVSLCDKMDPVTQKYLDKVKAAGYNALVDDNDAGRLSRTPMMILKTSALPISSVTKMSAKMIKDAGDSIVPMDGESYEKTIRVASSNHGKQLVRTYLALMDYMGKHGQ